MNLHILGLEVAGEFTVTGSLFICVVVLYSHGKSMFAVHLCKMHKIEGLYI